MKTGTLEYAVVYGMVATDDHLYVVGDFDLVRTKSGAQGVVEFAVGFARFSFADQEWEAMEPDALNDVGLAIDIKWPSAFIGGQFTSVSTSISSKYIAQADFTEAVDAPELDGIGVGRAASIFLEKPSPNPSSQGVRLGYLIPHGTKVDLGVFDISGRLVRQIVREWKDSGEHVANWDGKTEEGLGVVPGVYWARLSASGTSFSEKIVIVK